MRRLSHRLRPRWPAWLVLAGPALLTAAWVALLLFAIADPTLKPHQLSFTVGLLGLFSLLCIVALAKPLAQALFGPSAIAEVSLQPARRGEPLRCFAVQEGPGVLDVRLQCLRARRGGEDVVLDLPVGRAAASGRRAQVEDDVQLPPDAPPSVPFQVRWRLRVATAVEGVPEIARDFPLTVV